MTADSQGNDVGAVGIPITGNIAVAAVDVANVISPAEGGVLSLSLPVAYRKLGLIKTDGGFDWTTEADGDPIEFFQSGYSIPSGNANASLEVGLAQNDAIVREVTYGKVPDANGYITIDAGGHATRYLVYTEEIYKNGWIERRLGVAYVSAAKVDKTTRGEVRGVTLTFMFDRSPYFNDEHFGQWLVDSNTAAPVITEITPSGAGEDDIVQIVGTNFTGATAVTFDAIAATDFEVLGPLLIVAVLPADSAGAVDVVVTTPEGASDAFSYTRT